MRGSHTGFFQASGKIFSKSKTPASSFTQISFHPAAKICRSPKLQQFSLHSEGGGVTQVSFSGRLNFSVMLWPPLLCHGNWGVYRQTDRQTDRQIPLTKVALAQLKIAPWSSWWFEEISVALIWLALIALIWVAFQVTWGGLHNLGAFGKSEPNWCEPNQSTYRQGLPKVCVQQFHSQDEDQFRIFWAIFVQFRLGIML